jgi:hypothetical protein
MGLPHHYAKSTCGAFAGTGAYTRANGISDLYHAVYGKPAGLA